MASIRTPGGERPGPGEGELISAAQAGDADSLESLAALWWPWSYSAAAATLGSTEFAADVAQEAVLSALRGIDRFEAGRKSRPWVTRIATNRALDWLRAESRRPVSTELPDDLRGVVVGTSELVELVDVLARIAPKTRAMLVLHHLGGFSSAEVGEMLGMKAGTVRSAMSRAIEAVGTEEVA